ncbi:MAG: hypothetical protein RR777_07500, partial [Christensenellaceae bacterium]
MRVGSGSNPVITDDAQIKRGAPRPIITNAVQSPAEWARQKTISATVADADSGVTSAWYSTSGTDSSAGKVAMSRTSGTTASGTWT